MSARRPSRTPVIAAAALALALVAAIALVIASADGGSGGKRPESGALGINNGGFAGAELPQPPAAHDFTLIDATGEAVSLGSLRGQVVVVAFLSSACGRTCVLIAQQIRGALDELATPAPALLVSVDPTADTRARRRAFLASVSLSGRARFLSGPARQLAAIWRAYRVRPLSAGASSFEGSATVLLIDRSGRERVLFGLEQLTPEGLAHDIRKLQAHDG
jgi:protein SCO1/2